MTEAVTTIETIIISNKSAFFSLKIRNKRTIIDFKTSKALYPEMFLQAAAYAVAREEEMKKRFTGGVILLRLSKENKEKGKES